MFVDDYWRCMSEAVGRVRNVVNTKRRIMIEKMKSRS